MQFSYKGGVRNDHADVLWKFQIEMERKVAIPSDETKKYVSGGVYNTLTASEVIAPFGFVFVTLL